MIRYTAQLLILYFILYGQVFAQTYRLHGRVSDKQSGEPLIAANIQIAGTFRGTISNENGRFQLELNELPVELIISYIGYQTKTIRISRSPDREFQIALEPVIFDAEPIIVIAEDPGMQIMREVIRRSSSGLKMYIPIRLPLTAAWYLRMIRVS